MERRLVEIGGESEAWMYESVPIANEHIDRIAKSANGASHQKPSNRRALAVAAIDFAAAFCYFANAASRQRLSRVAEGTGPLTPQQPGCNCQGANSCPVGRDKILN